jgi:hypothetical protein
MHFVEIVINAVQTFVLVYFTAAVRRPLTILAHEAGHAFAGWSVGLKLKSFDIGVNGGQCIFHENARAHALTSKPAYIAWIAVSGSLANAVLAAFLLWMALHLYRSVMLPGLSVPLVCLSGLGLTNAVVASFLFFHRKHSDSDGYRLGVAWQMWRAKKVPPTT